MNPSNLGRTHLKLLHDVCYPDGDLISEEGIGFLLSAAAVLVVQEVGHRHGGRDEHGVVLHPAQLLGAEVGESAQLLRVPQRLLGGVAHSEGHSGGRLQICAEGSLQDLRTQRGVAKFTC